MAMLNRIKCKQHLPQRLHTLHSTKQGFTAPLPLMPTILTTPETFQLDVEAPYLKLSSVQVWLAQLSDIFGRLDTFKQRVPP